MQFCSVLIYPPYLDPTTPPHSVAYLSGAARQHDFPSAIFIDANAELHCAVMEKAFFDRAKRECHQLLTAFEARPEARLSLFEKMQYREALKCIGLEYSDVYNAFLLFKDAQRFFDFAQYQGAVAILERYFEVIAAPYAPGLFGVGRLNHQLYGSLSRVADLCDPGYMGQFVTPFHAYFSQLWCREPLLRAPVIGISCNYLTQLPYTIHTARMLRAINPNCTIVVGGTEVTDVYKNIEEKDDIWRLFPSDALIVIGEGESAWVHILEWANGDRANITHANIVRRGETTRRRSALVEDINAIGAPDYNVYSLAQYWVPEPVLMYSPSRGCYWNKCTFCDYGLNFGSPTSPSRQRDIKGVAEELNNIRAFATYVYFAVDALAPSYLRKLANQIRELQLGVLWSAEVRLERSMARRSAGKELAEGGCVGLSFGYESGSQRVLDLINKGVDLEVVPSLLSDLASSGIAVQMMGFLGFPGETLDEARQTLEFLISNDQLWVFAAIGNFVLTPGAIVAKTPQLFGVSRVSANPGDDVIRELNWFDEAGTLEGGNRHDGVRDEIGRRTLARCSLNRPFVGGIDTAHSMLYFGRFRDPHRLRQELQKPPATVGQDDIRVVPFADVLGFPRPQDLWQIYETIGRLSSRSGYQEKLRVLQSEDSCQVAENRVRIKASGNIYADWGAELGDLATILEAVCR